jgi:acyl-CoA synthetase (AMP-forming)/AMP-acid ligase II
MPLRLSENSNLASLLSPNGASDRTAIVFEDRAISLGELHRDANAIAATLRALDIGAGSAPPAGTLLDRVVIISGNRPEFVPIFFGAMRAGCTVVPISPRQPPQVVQAMLLEIEPRIVFAERAWRELIPPDVQVVEIESLASWQGTDADTADEFVAMSPGPDDLAEILYTSGSTGRPRGVPLTHRGQAWFFNTFLDATGWTPETALVAAPLFHMNALIRLKCALATGGKVILQRSFSPQAYIEAIERHRVTLLTGVPAMYAILLERGDLLRSIDTSSVTRLMLGSGAASVDLVSRLRDAFPRATIGVAYGLSESGGTVSSTLVKWGGESAPPGSVGKPFHGFELRFGDPPGAEGVDQGVLYLRGPSMAKEYFRQPDATADRFVDGWLKTNDVLRRDAQGWLYFLGRSDDMYVCGGENVYPSQLEALLVQLPQVAQAVVVPVPDAIRGQVGCAFVVLRDGEVARAPDLQSQVATMAPSHLHAHHLHVLDAMPLSGVNKVDLVRLRKLALELSNIGSST